MFDPTTFIKDYYRALKDIISTLPASASLPAFLENTSFVIGCSDIVGRVAVDIVSRKNLKEIILNGKTISPQSPNEPGFLISQDIPSLEGFIFPQDDKGTSVSIRIGERYVVLDGLAFSNKEYNDKYWGDAKFYRNCAGNVPFSVISTGSMLGLDLLWGAELNGQRQERLFEFIKIYGNTEMLPIGDKEIRDEAFRDFGFAAPKLGKGLVDWSFTDFLSSLKTPVDRNVLLLGSYTSEREFELLRAILKDLGYHAFLLKDSPDLPIQSNLEKLFSAIICSCFVIVIDKEASGHIAELGHMLQFRFRPVIILREQDQPATAFLEDRILTDDFFRVAIIKNISAEELLPHFKWARELIDKQIQNFNTINHWRKQ